ncbi:MAG: cytochrome ubiquinol oxidase subunit I [Nitrospira sp.]|nr:cytochrome ubiquinol oxidase subunit I [Nitrospira sp.]
MPEFGGDLEAISFPLIGNSLIIGLFSLLHIALAGLAVGFMVLAPLLETADRVNPFYADFSRSMTRFTIVTFSVSTVLAVIMVELSIGLFPLTTMWMWNQFRWPILLAMAAFILQLAVLYPYYHYWDFFRQRHRRVHILMGFLAAFFVLIWVVILDGMGSTMLTPETNGGPWGRLLNPTWIPLVIHRFFGNLVMAGFAMAGYAGWRLRKQAGRTDESYYAHLLRMGVLIGLLSLIVQPATGLLYASQIERAVPRAYAQLTQGPYRGLVYAQFLLIAWLFLGGLALLRLTQSPPPPPPRAVLTAASICALLIVVFATSPSIRRPVTFLLAGLIIWSLYRWRAALTGVPTVDLNRPMVRRMAITMGVVSLLTYLTMGTIRETARRPDTVRGVISLQDELQQPAADRGP